jgi:diaminopimelate epimerase
MIDIPFTKAHGARNDFLLTWRTDLQAKALQDNALQVNNEDYPAAARAICDRYTGVGADGWMLVDADPPAIELYNSDGSKSEMSGNGTRCAAAFLIREKNLGDRLSIQTGAGLKHLTLLRRSAPEYWFEMDMGTPVFEADRMELALSTGPRDVTVLNVGNPQCAVPVTDFDFDWRAMGREIESHRHFPNKTNVSFVRPVDEHSIEVRFYERGAGETMSSGTGSTGAAAAAVRRGFTTNPVRVLTPAGPLDLRWDNTLYLTGPAELVVDGTFHYATLS